jgi:hypothetical protein
MAVNLLSAGLPALLWRIQITDARGQFAERCANLAQNLITAIVHDASVMRR